MKPIKNLLLGGLMGLATLQGSAATFVGDRTDFRDETIYFAMTTRFYDGDPSNNVCGWDHQNVQIANGDPDWRGDFKGLIDKLDYIKALGFTAIWITPVVQNASGTDFHGYHAMDFSKVDLRYESRKEWGASEDVTFQSLIDAAHAKGMKIVLDIVLNHTSNFGEDHFCHLFDRSDDIRNQASVSASLIPDQEKLGGASYWDLDPDKVQYPTRFKYLKNTDGQNHDNHNYWHHLANAWNWDYPSRWWGQIAGDCVDLNTENPAVAEYLVQCYGKFIEMGVDGFRIDTTGHISRLTFNTSFIPQFLEIAEQNKSKRLNGCPFFMFGECCARFSDVTYRDQPNLSSYFYTWKSPESMTSQWNYDASYWDKVEILEGNDNTYGNMNLCLDEPSEQRESDNVFMKDGAWHEPDYSDYSGFSIIDFPMHYNFNNQAAAVDVAKKGDKYYNDASYNVVYVDSHDYCPGPNDGTRFNGSTGTWAENLALMFTFRGIPCLYYGSEVEFKKGCKVDAGGTDMPVKDSGRAYFGEYLEGTVTTTDFCEYTASGNVDQTLNGDLSQHIRRLNQIRAAVPALRKGQYTFDGCSANGGHAFKRAYKDSYALVALNGGATFSNVPAGTYTDLVTGKTYQGGGSITVDAPATQGQVRVLVKDWKGGKVGEDGKFIYATSPVAHGGSVSFPDVPTDQFYTSDDVVKDPSVVFSPNGGSFKTETLTVTATLGDNTASGWYQIAGGDKVSISGGNNQFTIGNGMAYGSSIVVNWGATGSNGKTYTGSVTYKKVDPNATITIYVKGSGNMYAWGNNSSGSKVEPCGTWPGAAFSSLESTTVDGDTYYYYTFDDLESVSVIFNNNGQQTGNIEGITEDTYFDYNGSTNATKVDVNPAPKKPVVTASPASGTSFNETITVTLRSTGNVAIHYTLDGSTPSATSATYTSPLTFTETTTLKTFVENEVGSNVQEFVYTKTDIPVGTEFTIYYDNSTTNWNPVHIHYWSTPNTTWPGVAMTKVEGNIWKFTFDEEPDLTGFLFCSADGKDQTNDFTGKPQKNHIYKGSSRGSVTDEGIYEVAGISDAETSTNAAPVDYNLQGVQVANPTPGLYIVVRGNKITKEWIR